MGLFGKKPVKPGADWPAVPAEILEVQYGLVHNTNSGVGGSYERSSADKTLRLRVEPTGGAAYEAEAKVDRNGPDVPNMPGTRVDVLVDPADPQRVALPDDPTFTLPGGQQWQPTEGIAGAIAEASKRGDANEVMRLSAEIQRKAADAKASEPPPS
jgi:hypothetical protein